MQADLNWGTADKTFKVFFVLVYETYTEWLKIPPSYFLQFRHIDFSLHEVYN